MYDKNHNIYLCIYKLSMYYLTSIHDYNNVIQSYGYSTMQTYGLLNTKHSQIALASFTSFNLRLTFYITTYKRHYNKKCI